MFQMTELIQVYWTCLCLKRTSPKIELLFDRRTLPLVIPIPVKQYLTRD